MVRESRARKQKAVQWPPGGGSSAFCIAPRPKWMAETRPSPKVGPRTNPLGSGVARRRRGRPRFTFLRYMTRLGVARIWNAHSVKVLSALLDVQGQSKVQLVQTALRREQQEHSTVGFVDGVYHGGLASRL